MTSTDGHGGRARVRAPGNSTVLLGCTIALALLTRLVAAQVEEPPPPPPVSLKTVPVPGPLRDELGRFVQDKRAAILLGKALFWDTRVGSDNKTACATCHFHAGADPRTKNQISPGLLAGDRTFQLGGPNYTVKASDFPFTRHANVDDAATRVADLNDVVSSQGVFTTAFIDIGRPGSADVCESVSDAVSHGGSGFNINGVNTRRVEPRNAPSVINAIFNFRNFWDGRANNMANGNDPFGLRNAAVSVWRLDHGVLKTEKIVLPTSSLASLGSGPPLSENEMSCRNRTFAKLARKLVESTPLADQTIAGDDSVLGLIAQGRPTYAMLIRRAFRPEYWLSPRQVNLTAADADRARPMDLERSRHAHRPRPRDRNDVSQMEANFALFFGLAVQLYQSTLVSDDTPFDRYAEGRAHALSARQLRGLALFRGAAQCIHCHNGAEFTSASFTNVLDEGRLDHRDGDNGTVFRYDNGFFNTGVRPTADDIGVGGVDPFNHPLSETRMAQNGDFDLLGNEFDIAKELAIDKSAPTAVEGAFKTPGLRNVELTGPYFHNGGKATLMQVVDFYNRGGDFGAANKPVTDPAVHPLGLTQAEKEDLVAFLLALSDERVRYRKAPFDHPSICVPHGHKTERGVLLSDGAGQALDDMMCLAAVGARGSPTPLRPFLGLDPFQR
jgi:cytochrome c peroxidase